jgi:hypothetical protein
MSNNNKIPLHVFYDSESKIVSSDFRSKDNIHICIDDDGLLLIRNVNDVKDFKKINLMKKNYKYVKFNPLNDFQYFICSETDFKIYDIRNNLEMDSVDAFADSIDIFNDSKNFLIAKNEGLFLYTFCSSKMESVKEWTEFDQISHANMNIINYSNPELILIGNEQGDVFYSN